MNDREKAIVMAYTGVCMLTGDKLSVFYEYVEGIMGRPVYTHEMGTKVVDDLIKEKTRPDFMALCADEGSSEKPNKWIDAEVLDKIREEIKSKKFGLTDTEDGRRIQSDIHAGFDGGIECALQIIDRYKASPTGAEEE